MQITREEFRKACVEANDEFLKTSQEVNADDLLFEAALMLQNLTFSVLLEEILFDKH